MMTQVSRYRPLENSLLHATVLNEIVGPQSTQVVVDELGLAMATHQGSKRSRNEDRIAVARVVAPNSETYTIALVCDGVGGSESGDQAAALAITSIIVGIAEQRTRPPLKELAIASVRQADDFVRRELQGRGATTLVMLLATASGGFICASVGDSRAYSWTPGSGRLNQVTMDDTIENELKNLPGNPDALIKAHGLQGRLSQAIGENGRLADELRVQIYPKENFRSGAVLGSDGLWRAAKDFEATVANATTPTDAARRSIALANWVGGIDNASIIAIGDVEQLCNTQQTHIQQQKGIVLWVSLTKIKIPINNWPEEADSASPRARPEKKRRDTKKKQRDSAGGIQLALETKDFNDSRPRIEIVVDEELKKGE